MSEETKTQVLVQDMEKRQINRQNGKKKEKKKNTENTHQPGLWPGSKEETFSCGTINMQNI